VKKTSVSVLVAAGLLLALFVVLACYGPVGSDWFQTYHPVANRLWRGETRLYDARGGEFYNAPWTMLLLAPLARLPLRAGQAALTIFTLISLLAVTRAYTSNLLYVALALSTAFVLDHVLRGQVDAFALGGVILGMWALQHQRPVVLSAAYWLMLIKPVNLSLPLLLLTIALIRHWPWRDWVIVSSFPVLSVAVAAVWIGPTWPLRYVQHLVSTPPWPGFAICSLWDVLGWGTALVALVLVALLAHLALRDGVTRGLVALALALNLLLASYANDDHYVLLIPAWLWLVECHWGYVGLYPLTWLPLARLGGLSLEILYPLLLTGGLLWHLGFQGAPLTAAEPRKEVKRGI